MQNVENERVDVSGETHWVILTLAHPVMIMQNLDSTLLPQSCNSHMPKWPQPRTDRRGHVSRHLSISPTWWTPVVKYIKRRCWLVGTSVVLHGHDIGRRSKRQVSPWTELPKCGTVWQPVYDFHILFITVEAVGTEGRAGISLGNRGPSGRQPLLSRPHTITLLCAPDFPGWCPWGRRLIL